MVMQPDRAGLRLADVALVFKDLGSENTIVFGEMRVHLAEYVIDATKRKVLLLILLGLRDRIRVFDNRGKATPNRLRLRLCHRLQ